MRRLAAIAFCLVATLATAPRLAHADPAATEPEPAATGPATTEPATTGPAATGPTAAEIACPANSHREGEACVADTVVCPRGSVWRAPLCYARSRAVAIRTTGQVLTALGFFWAFVGVVTARAATLRSDDFGAMAAISSAAPFFGHAVGAITLGASLWYVGAHEADAIPAAQLPTHPPAPPENSGASLELRFTF